jgi:hypothetical protein
MQEQRRRRGKRGGRKRRMHELCKYFFELFEKKIQELQEIRSLNHEAWLYNYTNMNDNINFELFKLIPKKINDKYVNDVDNAEKLYIFRITLVMKGLL